MRTGWRNVSRWGYAVLMAAGLGFGAQTALAEAGPPPKGAICLNGRCTAGNPPTCPGSCIVEGWVLDGVCDPDTFCCVCPS